MYNFNGVERVINVMLPVKNSNRFMAANDTSIVIREALSHSDNCMKNAVLYRGDVNELKQLYIRLGAMRKRDNFWSRVPDGDYDVNRIHSGLPALMVDTMTNIVLGDLRDITFENDADTEVWSAIAKENRLNSLLDEALKKVLYLGDGAFKVTYETAFTENPIMEFYAADSVDFVRHRGRIQEIVFKTKYTHNSTDYFLHERYGYGYILNKLYKGNDEVPLNSIPITAGLTDVYFAGGKGSNGRIEAKGEYMLAVPFMVYTSSKYEGRGESIFDKRESMIVAMDADISQWQDSLESGAPKTFVDKKYLGVNPQNGTFLKPNAFNRFYVVNGARSEKGEYGIDTVQFDIPWQSYFETHAAFLDGVLMGFMSPSSLGIDVKKTDNSEAQREKEKVTLYTRSYIVEAMTEVVKELATIAVQSYYDLHGISSIVGEPDVNFGDYANPSFEAVVETVSKAKQGGIMSIETCVEELYGDSKTEEWKKAEVERIIADAGYTTLEEPSFGGDVDYSF